MITDKNKSMLSDTIRLLDLAHKGIHAADESGGSIEKKFAELQVQNTPENRIAYRGAMITTPHYSDTIGGVILFDETLRQSYESRSVISLVEKQAVVIGVKVDSGLEAFNGSKLEQVGVNKLNDLPKRMDEYSSLGVRFTKFRVVGNIGIDEAGVKCPTNECITANAKLLAGYAKICQDYGIVPIIEPEVPIEKSTHTLEQCKEVSLGFLRETFAECVKAGVYIPGVVLKTNMVLPGNKGPKVSDDDIAAVTIEVLKESVPQDIGAVVFLSGGQPSDAAFARLRLIRALAAREKVSFPISSSYSRALQGQALEAFAAAINSAGSTGVSIKAATQKAFADSLAKNNTALKL